MATAKKRTTKKTTKKLTWGKDVKHPIRKTPCGGRPMSQRDMKLFTKMGKRRAGVTLSKIKEAYPEIYGKKKVAPKKKAAPKKVTGRKPLRKTAAKRSTPKRKLGSKITVSGCPRTCQRYVVVDGSNRYQSSHKLLSSARKKQAALEAKFPRKVIRIIDMKG
jgi:hypothetical protein